MVIEVISFHMITQSIIIFLTDNRNIFFYKIEKMSLVAEHKN